MLTVNSWQQLTIQDMAVSENGIVDGPFGSNLKLSDYINDIENGVPVLSTKNVNGSFEGVRYISKQKFDELKRSKVEPGDIIVAKIGSIGKCGIYPLNRPTAIIPANLLKITPKDSRSTKYLYYYIKSAAFQERIKGISTATAQPAFNVTKFRRLPIRVPSIPEQERIVTRIEELFSELDKAVETLQTTKQQLAVYRQAVLKEAFSSCTQTASIESVCVQVTDGDHMPPPKSREGIPFIMISNINRNQIQWEETNYVSQEYYNAIGDKRTPKKGDVLYTVTGSFGIPILVDFDHKFCFQRHIALLRPNDRILQKYLYFSLQSPDVFSQASHRATGTAQKTVGLAVLRTIKIPYVDELQKQESIVATIESRLSVCDTIEQTVDKTLAQADAMRQSILKQAFEGRL